MILTDEHCAAIRGAIPPHVKVSRRFWRELDTAVVLFRVMAKHRAGNPQHQLKQWRRTAKLAGDLADELPKVRKQDYGERDFLLRALRDFRDFAENNIIGLQSLIAGRSRRRRPHHELLYSDIVNLWVYRLKQPLRISRSAKQGKPGGPFIRFFRACVGPILGHETPSAEGIVKLVKRERKRLRKVALSRGRMRTYAPSVKIKLALVEPRRHGT